MVVGYVGSEQENYTCCYEVLHGISSPQPHHLQSHAEVITNMNIQLEMVVMSVRAAVGMHTSSKNLTFGTRDHLLSMNLAWAASFLGV